MKKEEIMRKEEMKKFCECTALILNEVKEVGVVV